MKLCITYVFASAISEPPGLFLAALCAADVIKVSLLNIASQ